jgi:hypothetical protein
MPMFTGTEWRRRTGLRLLLALSVLLASCATTAPPPSQGQVGAGEGIVVLSVTGNTGQVGQFSGANLRPIDPVGGPIRPLQLLRNVAAGLARDTALFIGVVPAGDYTLDRLTVDNRYLAFGAGTLELIGTIRVKAGAVNDLGRVVVTPINARVLVGRSALVTSNVELIKRFSPENAPSLNREIVSGWVAPRSAKDQVEEYALSRPVGADSPIELANGDVAAASRLGNVLVRRPDGRWSAIHSGRLESLLAVHAPAGGTADGQDARLIAVGEFNTLLRLSADGKLIALDSGTLPAGNLLAIAGNDSSGWFVAQQHAGKVTLYESPKLDRGEWSAIRTEEVAFSFWSGANNFWMWSTDSGFAYAVSEGRIGYYDYATKAWTQRRAPGTSRLVTLATSNKGALGILTSPGGGFAGVFATLYLSTDRAATWTEVKSPFSIKIFAPRLLADGTWLVGGGVFSDPELHASTDKGVTWQLRSDKFSLSENVVVLPTAGLLSIDPGAQFGLARIRHSADGGATWKVEYSNFDRAAYEAQQQRK